VFESKQEPSSKTYGTREFFSSSEPSEDLLACSCKKIIKVGLSTKKQFTHHFQNQRNK
jgi:hypothetical protein